MCTPIAPYRKPDIQQLKHTYSALTRDEKVRSTQVYLLPHSNNPNRTRPLHRKRTRETFPNTLKPVCRAAKGSDRWLHPRLLSPLPSPLVPEHLETGSRDSVYLFIIIIIIIIILKEIVILRVVIPNVYLCGYVPACTTHVQI